ncbi:MAG: Ig-like domain-containing protein [Candidatus Korarchaeota archaeon]
MNKDQMICLLILALVISAQYSATFAASTVEYEGNSRDMKVLAQTTKDAKFIRSQDTRFGSHLQIMGISSEVGWKDPYFDLAAYWAPVIYQDTDDSYYKGDYITRFDFDGDWIGNNNWENLEYYNQIYAYVYYAVIETETHYFIFYMFFHPRDWDDTPLSILQHENDMEGVLIVITKGQGYGSFLLMESRAHFDFYQYTNDPNIGSGSDNVDGGVIFQNGRPTVFIEAKGHGVYAWDGSEFPGGDGVIYRYYNNQTDYPTSGNDRDVEYALVPIIRTLWPRRYSIGDGLTYDKPFIYSGARYSFQRAIGGAFDGDTHMPDSANPPWGMDDLNDGPVYNGDWFFDPAYTVQTHLSIPYSFSLNYVYNPYLIEDGPEWDAPTITLNSPIPDKYYNTNGISISVSVDDAFDIYLLTITINGSVIYTSRSKGIHSFIYNAPSDGVYLASIMAMDIWGNYRNISFKFFIDTAAPSIETTINNGSWVAGSSLDFYWYAADNFGINKVTVLLDNIKVVDRYASSGYENITFNNEGLHTITLKVYDLASNLNQVNYIVRVDYSQPMLSIISPENNTITSNNSVTIRWWSYDSVYLDKHEIYINNQLLALLNNSTREFTINNVPEGTHVIKIVAYDRVGHVASREITVRVDRTPPSLDILSPQNDSLVPMRFNITWHANDNMGLSIIRLLLDDIPYAELAPTISTYEIELDSGGLHTVKIVAYDVVGLYSEKVITVYCDIFPPIVTIQTENGTVFRTDIVFISWNVQEDYGISSRYVVVDSNYIPVYKDNITLALSEGMHVILVRIVDVAGNIGEAKITIFVDINPPYVRIVSPVNGSYISQRLITISWYATDACGIVRTEVHVNNVIYYPQGSSITVELTSEGLYNLTLIVFDYAGNSARSLVMVTADFTPPTLVVISPENYSRYPSNVDVAWSASDAFSGISRVRIFVNGSLFSEFASSSGSKTLSLTGGFYIITVEAIDGAGNNRCINVYVFVAYLQIISPENNANVSLKVISLIVHAVYVYDVKVYINGSYIATFNVNQQIALELPNEGQWIITVTDSTQPCINASIRIRADWTAPSIVINLPEYSNTSKLRVSWSGYDTGSDIKEFELYVNGSKYWNGKSNSVWITLSEGIWNITVVAIDFTGNRQASWRIAIIDLTPPIVLLSITNGTTFQTVYISISWNTTDNLSGVSNVSIYLNGVLQGIYSASGSIDLMLKNGQYRITLTTRDRAGNYGYTTAVFSVSAPPLLLVYGPENNSYIANSTVSFSWSVFNGQLKEQKVYLNGKELSVSGTSVTLENLADGMYNLTVVVETTEGEILSVSVIFYIDKTPPELEILKPANCSYTNKTYVKIEVIYSDNFEVVRMMLLVNDTVFELSPTNSIDLNLKEGDYIIAIRVYDRAGNYNEKVLRLTVDLTNPTVRIIEPENNTQTNKSEITIKWYTVDNVGVERIEVWVNNTLVAVLHGDVRSYTILINASVIVRIIVYDLAGNSAYDEILVRFNTNQNKEVNSLALFGEVGIAFLFLATIALGAVIIIWKNKKKSPPKKMTAYEEYDASVLSEIAEELDELFTDEL